MDLYVLTREGSEAINVLQKAMRHEEAGILEYLGMRDGATVDHVADFMHVDKDVAYDKLRSLSAKRWVWYKQTKLTQF
jgi:DNA-binding MarR family transcriptional regulator